MALQISQQCRHMMIQMAVILQDARMCKLETKHWQASLVVDLTLAELPVLGSSANMQALMAVRETDMILSSMSLVNCLLSKLLDCTDDVQYAYDGQARDSLFCVLKISISTYIAQGLKCKQYPKL